MLRKPSGCEGCPFYGNGQGFVPDELRDSEVFIVGQNPGADEERQGVPFVGRTGEMMEAKFLPLAGLDRSKVSIGNAIRCRVNGANELPPLGDALTRKAVEHCTRAHLKIPQAKLIVTQGAYALYAMTGHGVNKYDKVTDWRGWMLPTGPLGGPQIASGIWEPGEGEGVLATLHLAAIFREPDLQHPTKYDWAKVAKILAGKWPEPMPPLRLEPPTSLPDEFALDTEFIPETRQLIRYSLAWRDAVGTPIVHVVDGSEPRRLASPSRPRVIFHHTGADQDYADLMLPGGYDIEDTMHSHAVLWSDLPHDLDFRGSMHARTNRWKHLFESAPLIYSGADALGTYDIWQHDKTEFARDPASEAIYRNLQLRLIPIIRRAGNLRVNSDKARRALDELEAVCGDAEAQAQAAVGWPMNLGSGPQVTKQLYHVERVHEKARRRT